MRLVQVLVQPQITTHEQPPLPRRRESDLVGLTAFILDVTGRIVSWTVTATPGAIAVPAMALEGTAEKASFAGLPGVILKVLEVDWNTPVVEKAKL